MRKVRRMVTAIGASVAAAGVLTAAAAWACTPLGHQGSIWWCNTSGSCPISGADVNYVRGTTAFYGSASGLEKANTAYEVRYVIVDPLFLTYSEQCNLSPTTLSIETTDASGAWSGKQMTAPTPPTPPSAGSVWYELCAAPDTTTGYLDKGAVHTSILVLGS